MMVNRLLPRGEDGELQPLTARQLAVGDWACLQWHGWPAAALVDARNVAGEAPACPTCGYSLWRISGVESNASGTPMIAFDERDKAANDAGNAAGKEVE